MLLTLDEAKQYLEITGTGQDEVLNSLIRSVTTFMKNTALNRDLESATYKQLYDGNGLNRIVLDEYPIISVAKLSKSLDNSAKTYTDVLTEGTEFFKTEGGIIELFEDVFAEQQRSVYIDYTAGYIAADIPDDIKDVCKQLIAKRMQDIAGKRFGITTKNVFDDSVSFEISDLTPGMKKVLSAYRKRPSSNGVDVTGWVSG